MPDMLNKLMLTFAVRLFPRLGVSFARNSLDGSDGFSRLFNWRRGHAAVVTGEGIAVAYCEMSTTRLLESFVNLIGAFRNRTGACLAKRMTARRAVGAPARYGRLTDVTSSHARVWSAVRSIELGEYLAHIILGALHQRGIALVVDIGVFRELARWTINAVFCEQLPSLGHGDLRHLDSWLVLLRVTAEG